MKTFQALATMAIVVIAGAASVAHAETGETSLATIAAKFANANVVSGPALVDCTLSGGAQTSCFAITVEPVPTQYTPGPWCPTDIADGPDQGGLWIEDGKVYDVDGAFLVNLATFYNDPNWDLINDDGSIRVTDTAESCAAAARPDVDPAYQNHCVVCELEYVEPGTVITYIIPVAPVSSPAVSALTNGAGVAYNGIRLDGPAPVDAILGAYTIAAFDDCAGHVNLAVGYHYHGATDCLLDVANIDLTHAAEIGVSMDGFAMFARQNSDGSVASDLDQCNGHSDDANGYHYHAGQVGSNAILNCLVAQTGCVLTGESTQCDATQSGRPPRGGQRPE